MMQRDYFVRNHDLLSFLAGTTAVKLRLKENVFRYHMREVALMIERQATRTEEEIKNEYKGNQSPYNLHAKTLGSVPELMKSLRTGFDEIFLLHVFRNLVCMDIREDVVFDERGSALGGLFFTQEGDRYEQFLQLMLYSPMVNSEKVKKIMISEDDVLELVGINTKHLVLLKVLLEKQNTREGKEYVVDAFLSQVQSVQILPVNSGLLNFPYYQYSLEVDHIYDFFHEEK